LAGPMDIPRIGICEALRNTDTNEITQASNTGPDVLVRLVEQLLVSVQLVL